MDHDEIYFPIYNWDCAIETIGEDRILKYMFRVNPNKELHCNGDCECCDEYDPWDEEDED